jgi:hypothetical protein
MKNTNDRATAAATRHLGNLRRALLVGLPLGLLPLGFLSGGCSSGSSAGDTNLTPGSIHVNPQTGNKFVVEANRGGSDSNLRISRTFWGRLVDVYDEVTFTNPLTQEKSFTNSEEN